MPTTASRIADWIEELAPSRLAEDWDNVGLQCGRLDREVAKVLTALTVTHEVIREAERGSFEMIVAHHPVIFRPISRLDPLTPVGSILYKMVGSGLTCLAAHTNLDAAPGGVNDGLAARIDLRDVRALSPPNAAKVASSVMDANTGIGRIGKLPRPMERKEFLEYVQKSLKLSELSVAGVEAEQVEVVAVVGGSGGSFVARAKELGADVLITGDVDYHDADAARSLDLMVVDAGHFGTEKHVPEDLAAYLIRRARRDGVKLEVAAACEWDAFIR